MRAEFVNPFVQAATEILENELGTEVDRGDARLQKSAYTTTEVTALIAVSGQVEGLILFTMDLDVARKVVGTMLGREQEDDLSSEAEDRLCELQSLIADRASVLLSQAGYPVAMQPPVIVRGDGVMLTTLDLNRLVVPLTMSLGEIEIQVILRESQQKAA